MKPLAELTDDELLHVATAAARMRDAPEPVIQAAIALWPQGTLAGSAAALAGGLLREGVRRLRAVLESDSASPAFAGGLRSSAGGARHLLFSVEGFDIDLRIVSTAQGHEVSGQVLGPEEGGRVALHAADDPAGAPLQQVALDAFGEFRFAPVAVAGVVVMLGMPAGVIELPAIAFDLP